MHIIKSNINGNPNIGLLGINTKNNFLIGEKLRKKQKKEYEEALNKKIEKISIAGTTLIGVFCSGDNNKLLVPKIIFDNEEKKLKELNIEYYKIESDITCLGNTIIFNQYGAIISTEFNDEDTEKIKNILKIPVIKKNIAGLTIPGAVIVIHNDKAIIHKDASKEEVELVEKILKVKCLPATVNLGSPYLKAGIMNSESGLIVGDLSGGPEIIHIDEALGYHNVED